MTFTVGPARPRPGKVRPRPGPQPAKVLLTSPGPARACNFQARTRPGPQNIIEAWPGPAHGLRASPARGPRPGPCRTLVWACDAKGRDPHNKKHIEYDGDGNTTQRTSKDEMAWQTEKWHAHLWHQTRDGHWQRTLGCRGETRWYHGRRRKRLVTSVMISRWVWRSHTWAIWNIHIWRWVPYKNIFIHISAYKCNRNMMLVSKHTLLRSTIALETCSTSYSQRPSWNPR